MPTCPRCGKVNLKEALFCQDCGQRLEAASAAPAPVEKSAVPVCPKCKTKNEPGMSFCRMCGTPLGAPEPAPSLAQTAAVAGGPTSTTVPAQPAPAVAKLTCYSCGKQTPAGFGFCQHCGSRLATTSAATAQKPPAPESRTESKVATTVRAVEPRRSESGPISSPPVSMAPTVRAEAAGSSPPSAVTSSVSGPTATAVRGGGAGGSGSARDSRSMRSDPRIVPPHGRLIFLRDGKEAESQPVYGETFDIGRTDGSLVIGTDPHLAPRHARFTLAGTAVKLRSLDGTNGVFLRLREPHDLAPGDTLLIGRQLLRFETLAPEERELPSLVEQGVRLLGSPSREAWGRLRQLTAAGTTRDVYHLVRPEVALGRSEADILFPDDDLLSPRHCVLRRTGTRARIEDAGGAASSGGPGAGGIYVRLRAERELKSGDVLRLGEQTLRFETLA